MLLIQPISRSTDQLDVFETFDPATSTWLVSDLKSKLDLNRSLLRSRDFIPGESVLRASELWKLMLTRIRPDLQIVSREFVQTLVSQKLSKMDLAWARAPGASKAACEYLGQLMPILAHPSGTEMMHEWFERHPQSRTRWGRWFDLATRLWSEFLEEGFVAPAWASGVLVNELDLGEIWQRPLYVDLGAEMTQVEADLLLLLSEKIDVTVLRPEPEWKADYAKTLVAYEIFDSRAKNPKVLAKLSSKSTATGSVRHLKFTTMIAEVKDATAKARRWLDEAPELKASDIAIVAPDIETYWPALSSYLDQEGIPCQKDNVRKLHDFPDFALWLAELRLRSGSFSEADIEVALFESANGQATSRIREMTYDRFKVLYTAVYGRDDLKRSVEVARRFELEFGPESETIRDDFIAWSLKHVPEGAEFDRFESVYKRLFAECPKLVRFTVRRWMSYLEQLSSKIECRVRDGDPDGLACINLTSAENSSAKKMILLGLTEGALKSASGTGVLFSDVAELAREFGFHLASEDQAKLEFEARWLVEGNTRDLVLTVPETDFGGSVQAASWLWVKGARDQGVHDVLSIPSDTRWDELQKARFEELSEIRGWAAVHAAQVSRALSEDLALAPIEAFGAGLIKSVSPSGIEDYLDCPFIFAAKRVFGLSDVSELELEVDASRRGSLMHKLFELLTLEPMRFDLGEAELGAIVEDAKVKCGLELADDRLWTPLRTRSIDLARRFLAFEREARNVFPETKTVGRELDIAGYLDPENGELLRDPKPGVMKFVGRIDRVDKDDRGNLAIFDYKSSQASVSQYGSWLKNNRIQLLLYAMAIESGLTILEPKPVQAALYYTSRPLDRDTGFKVDDADQALYDASDKRKRNRLSSAEKDTFFAQGRELLQKAASGILSGDFRPNPRDPKDCADCQWSAVCRAPHLNA